MARLQINCDFGIFVTSSTGHLGLTKDCALPLTVMFRRGPFVGGLIHEHLWDRRTESLSVRRGRGSHEERIEAKHTSSLPRFGPHGCVKPYSCLWFVLSSCSGALSATVYTSS